jgi:hypothetical protein
LVLGGGLQFEGDPLPSSRLGDDWLRKKMTRKGGWSMVKDATPGGREDWSLAANEFTDILERASIYTTCACEFKDIH